MTVAALDKMYSSGRLSGGVWVSWKDKEHHTDDDKHAGNPTILI